MEPEPTPKGKAGSVEVRGQEGLRVKRIGCGVWAGEPRLEEVGSERSEDRCKRGSRT